MASATLSARSAGAARTSWGVLLLTGPRRHRRAATFYDPSITALGLLFHIAVWVTGTGLLQVVAGIRLRKEIEGEVW